VRLRPEGREFESLRAHHLPLVISSTIHNCEDREAYCQKDTGHPLPDLWRAAGREVRIEHGITADKPASGPTFYRRRFLFFFFQSGFAVPSASAGSDNSSRACSPPFSGIPEAVTRPLQVRCHTYAGNTQCTVSSNVETFGILLRTLKVPNAPRS
jgi:hypothetical protein